LGITKRLPQLKDRLYLPRSPKLPPFATAAAAANNMQF